MKVDELLYWNGFGGFDEESNEYVINANKRDKTPVPWSHIIANEKMGSIITNNGGGNTWFGNSREFKITNWSNDSISDRPSEVCVFSDGNFSFGAMPNLNDDLEYSVRYGFGYANFILEMDSCCCNTKIFIPRNKNMKFYCFEFENKTDLKKNIYFDFLVDPILGVAREYSKKHVVVHRMNDYTRIFNRYNDNYSEYDVVFYSDLTSDGLFYKLDNMQNVVSGSFEVGPNSKKEFFVCIEVVDKDEMFSRLTINDVNRLFVDTVDFWKSFLGKIKVKTPVKSFDLMLNGWSLYQCVVSRIWGRNSFYQSGGAFGFRDQLQDILSLLFIEPKIARKQILYHAEHQFVEGDVLHWWHPEKNNGVRTRYSDDLLWLPFCVCEYVNVTGDENILDEEVSYVSCEPLLENEIERYQEVQVTDFSESLFLHCKRAIEKNLDFDELPLIGGGDWNDGMNNIFGESVWLRIFSLYGFRYV